MNLTSLPAIVYPPHAHGGLTGISYTTSPDLSSSSLLSQAQSFHGGFPAVTCPCNGPLILYSHTQSISRSSFLLRFSQNLTFLSSLPCPSPQPPQNHPLSPGSLPRPLSRSLCPPTPSVTTYSQKGSRSGPVKALLRVFSPFKTLHQLLTSLSVKVKPCQAGAALYNPALFPLQPYLLSHWPRLLWFLHDLSPWACLRALEHAAPCTPSPLPSEVHAVIPQPLRYLLKCYFPKTTFFWCLFFKSYPPFTALSIFHGTNHLWHGTYYLFILFLVHLLALECHPTEEEVPSFVFTDVDRVPRTTPDPYQGFSSICWMNN